MSNAQAARIIELLEHILAEMLSARRARENTAPVIPGKRGQS